MRARNIIVKQSLLKTPVLKSHSHNSRWKVSK